MKKTRYIPYGYTIRNGRTVIEHNEAEVIREIFTSYINGSSLKSIADTLTEKKVPYTERSDVWDKARIARIIENARYMGDDEYEPIIEETLYEYALRIKQSRQTNQNVKECEAIAYIRNKMRCAQCGSPMCRHVRTRDKVKERWDCTNDECGVQIRIPDGQLIQKITILLNRIIENSTLLEPTSHRKYVDSATVKTIQNEIDNELTKPVPSESFIISKIGEIATEMYKESQANTMIAARIAKRRIELMHPQETFNGDYFTDIVAYLTIDTSKRITIHTKTETDVTEGENEDGSSENT